MKKPVKQINFKFLIISGLIIIFLCYYIISIYNNIRTSELIKDQIFCQNKIDIYFDVYNSENQERSFSYTYFLWKKHNQCVDFQIYLALQEAYRIPSVEDIFYSFQETINLNRNINRKIIEGSSFKEIYFDSCFYYFNKGLFRDVVNFNIDSVFNKLMIESIMGDDTGFAKNGVWKMYLMGYPGFTQNTQLAHEWYNKIFVEDNEGKTNLIDTLGSQSNLRDAEESYESPFPAYNIIEGYWVKKIREGNTFFYESKKIKGRLLKTEYEMLLSALLMANKYQYKNAYWDVYKYLWMIFNCGKQVDFADMSEFDSSTKELALYHLRKAALFEVKDAMEIYNTIGTE